jgi:hypothetical protein
MIGDQRGLAGAVRAERRKDLSVLDREIDVVERAESGQINYAAGQPKA